MSDTISTLNKLHSRISELNSEIKKLSSNNEDLRNELSILESKYTSFVSQQNNWSRESNHVNSLRESEQLKIDEFQRIFQDINDSSAELVNTRKKARLKSILSRVDISSRLHSASEVYTNVLNKWDHSFVLLPDDQRVSSKEFTEVKNAIHEMLFSNIDKSNEKNAGRNSNGENTNVADETILNDLKKKVEFLTASKNEIMCEIENKKKQFEQIASNTLDENDGGDDLEIFIRDMKAAEENCEGLETEKTQLQNQLMKLNSQIQESNNRIDNSESELNAWHERLHASSCLQCKALLSPSVCLYCLNR